MLRIRLSRTGKRRQPSYRLVVAEHTAPIKSQFIEVLGHYNVSRTPREVVVDQERVNYWISVGAKPSDTAASLLKKLGMANMDRFIAPRNLKRKKKNATEEPVSSSENTPAAETSPAEEASTPS